MIHVQYNIRLDDSGKKYNCPQCGKKRFVRMKDYGTGNLLPDEVGRCDRENNCGYHLTAKQYFGYTPITLASQEIQAPKPLLVDYIPGKYLESSMKGNDKTNFASWLIRLFGRDVANNALSSYYVGRSRNDNGKASIFWRVDRDGNIRSGKIMQYSPITGKRDKAGLITWVHKQKAPDGSRDLFPSPFNLHLCFFGEHLLNEYPSQTVGITESEKTAIIASIFFPGLVWLATGGNSGCKWREYSVFKVLRGRKVILFPDFGYFNKKTQRTCFDEWKDRADAIAERMSCSLTVSRVLEDRLLESDRVNDIDLADILIKADQEKGMALVAQDGYPAIWDLTNLPGGPG